MYAFLLLPSYSGLRRPSSCQLASVSLALAINSALVDGILNFQADFFSGDSELAITMLRSLRSLSHTDPARSCRLISIHPASSTLQHPLPVQSASFEAVTMGSDLSGLPVHQLLNAAGVFPVLHCSDHGCSNFL